MVYLRLTYVPTYVDEIECLHHCRHNYIRHTYVYLQPYLYSYAEMPTFDILPTFGCSYYADIQLKYDFSSFKFCKFATVAVGVAKPEC